VAPIDPDDIPELPSPLIPDEEPIEELPSPLIPEPEEPPEPPDLGQMFTAYAVAHAQKQNADGKWVDREIPMVQDFPITATKQQLTDFFTPLAVQICDESDFVLLSVEIVSPAYYQYFRGF
jgi:hypothetical protein